MCPTGSWPATSSGCRARPTVSGVADRFPAIEPYDEGMLDVGDGQRIYWETSGNPGGTPAVVLHGDDSGIQPAAGSEGHGTFFTGTYQRRVLPGIGHNIPQEAPKAVVDAVLELLR